jgi:hypothetical protein
MVKKYRNKKFLLVQKRNRIVLCVNKCCHDQFFKSLNSIAVCYYIHVYTEAEKLSNNILDYKAFYTIKRPIKVSLKSKILIKGFYLPNFTI